MDIEKTCKYCKNYRTKVLKITQKEMCDKLGLNIKNLSAFENGRANNMLYISYYYNLSSHYWKDRFLKDIYEYEREDVVIEKRYSFD